MIKHLPSFALVLALILLAGCSSTYDQRYAFQPPIVSVGPEPGAAAAPADEGVRTLVSVVGVRNEDPEEALPESVEVRLRVENDSGQRVSFDPANLSLVTADLQPLPEPIVRPAGGFELGPGEDAVISAWFPLPGGAQAYDLSGVNVHWALSAGERRLSKSAVFERRRRERYPPPYGYPHVGFGFGYHHH